MDNSKKATMAVKLSKQDIDAALPKVQVGLNKYLWLQGHVTDNPTTFYSDLFFQKKYNGFYKVQRRNESWMSAYYSIMAEAAAQRFSFEKILISLCQATSRVEASFSSKLFATLNPAAPVIDAWVLVNTGIKLPYAGAKNRLQDICKVHRDLGMLFTTYLTTPDGHYLVNEFIKRYRACVTPEKMLDLVLWQTRPPKATKLSRASMCSSGTIAALASNIP